MARCAPSIYDAVSRVRAQIAVSNINVHLSFVRRPYVKNTYRIERRRLTAQNRLASCGTFEMCDDFVSLLKTNCSSVEALFFVVRFRIIILCRTLTSCLPPSLDLYTTEGIQRV